MAKALFGLFLICQKTCFQAKSVIFHRYRYKSVLTGLKMSPSGAHGKLHIEPVFQQYFLNFIFDPKSLVRLLHIKFQIFGIFPIVSHILCHVLPQFQTLFKILIYDNYNSENPKFQVSSQILGIKYKRLLELIINST